MNNTEDFLQTSSTDLFDRIQCDFFNRMKWQWQGLIIDVFEIHSHVIDYLIRKLIEVEINENERHLLTKIFFI